MDSNFNDSPQSQFNQQPAPDNNLVWAILCTVLCCLPFGIYAIICSNKVNKFWGEGNYQAANKAAADAKKWSIYGAIIGVVFIILYAIFIGVVGMSAISNGYR